MQFNGFIFPRMKPGYTVHSCFGNIIYIPRDTSEWPKAGVPRPLRSSTLRRELKANPDLITKQPGYSGPCVPCLFLGAKKPSTKVLLSFHGNAEDIFTSRGLVKIARRVFPLHVVSMEYKGYGVYPGDASAGSILEDADLVIQFLNQALQVPMSDIIIFGRSVGSGPACYVASKYNVHSLILMSPFTSLRALAKTFVGSLLQYLVAERFDNLKYIKSVKCPVFIVHGKSDSIVPYSHSKELWKCITTPSVLHLPHDMDHCSLNFYNNFIKPLRQFYDILGLDTTPHEPATGELFFPLEAFLLPNSAFTALAASRTAPAP